MVKVGIIGRDRARLLSGKYENTNGVGGGGWCVPNAELVSTFTFSCSVFRNGRECELLPDPGCAVGIRLWGR